MRKTPGQVNPSIISVFYKNKPRTSQPNEFPRPGLKIRLVWIFSATDHVKCPENILTSKLRVWRVGKEGRMERGRRGRKFWEISMCQKKVHTAHPGWNLDRRLFIFLGQEPDRFNKKSWSTQLHSAQARNDTQKQLFTSSL